MSTVRSNVTPTVPPFDRDVEDQRRFAVGTTGWTADDLDDDAFEAMWEAGAYEIVEGVLTRMPAARLDDGAALFKLMSRVQTHLDATGDNGTISFETDVILTEIRVPRVDALYVGESLLGAQAAANASSRNPRGKYGRVRVVPTLVVESVSIGHEAHDRVVKRRWYAEAGVHNYWILDAYAKSLEILVLDGKDYRTEQLGKSNDEVRPSLFPGLVVPLARIWA